MTDYIVVMDTDFGPLELKVYSTKYMALTHAYFINKYFNKNVARVTEVELNLAESLKNNYNCINTIKEEI